MCCSGAISVSQSEFSFSFSTLPSPSPFSHSFLLSVTMASPSSSAPLLSASTVIYWLPSASSKQATSSSSRWCKRASPLSFQPLVPRKLELLLLVVGASNIFLKFLSKMTIMMDLFSMFWSFSHWCTSLNEHLFHQFLIFGITSKMLCFQEEQEMVDHIKFVPEFSVYLNFEEGKPSL